MNSIFYSIFLVISYLFLHVSYLAAFSDTKTTRQYIYLSVAYIRINLLFQLYKYDYTLLYHYYNFKLRVYLHRYFKIE
jgi:hypothetical protein